MTNLSIIYTILRPMKILPLAREVDASHMQLLIDKREGE